MYGGWKIYMVDALARRRVGFVEFSSNTLKITMEQKDRKRW